ncbi:lipid A biosynthesis lauroyl acyltransferase [Exilibacterium tricleocarpae]|uniref:Lipid A biosynthesis lauroyl acyltransferase n=1 Tax=Exilibacterium tricleocarpae TaxID=2591008 RepID=A0A545T0D8_9GAMM|nr:lysophospholipid acyltransferase family protein [Exilibacterium tricleocarpae]TQV70682.1 lipid A biosynthesis lauroyl acyltransferase [Exilibacterium tricleocarpae]
MTTIKGVLAKFLLWLTALLPLAVNRALGSLLGRVNYRLNTQMRKVTEENLRLCFPDLDDSARRELACRSLIETGKTLTEAGAIWHRRYDWLQRRVLSVTGARFLRDAIALQRGVIVLVPHLGNWEVVGLHLSEYTAVTSLYQPPKLPLLEAVIRRGRQQCGATLVPTNRSGVSAVLKVLRRGGVTAILPDQVPDRSSGGEFAEFFGVPALTMTLVNNLLGRIGCRVLMAYAKRVPGGFDIVFQPAHEDIYSSDDCIALTGLNRSVEQCVREIPSQYQWEYKRFKKRPPNEPRLYRFKN